MQKFLLTTLGIMLLLSLVSFLLPTIGTVLVVVVPLAFLTMCYYVVSDPRSSFTLKDGAFICFLVACVAGVIELFIGLGVLLSHTL